MRHRMNDLISLTRKETARDERNRVTSTNLPLRDVRCCIRDVVSSWERTETNPVEWDYKATLAFSLTEDVRVDDRLTLPEHGEFFVVEAKKARGYLSAIAIQHKRGAEK